MQTHYSNSNRHLKQCLLILLFTSAVALNGCSKGQEQQDASYDEAVNNNQQMDFEEQEIHSELDNTDSLQIVNVSDTTEEELASQTSDIEIAGKELVVNANATFKVDDVVKTRDNIETLTRQQGGYIARSSIVSREVSSHTYTQQNKDITLTTYYREAMMTVRIPKQKVSAFLKDVQKQVKFLNNQEFTAKDVTLDLYREQLAADINRDMADELNQQRLDSSNEKEQASNVDSITATYSAKQRQKMAEINRMMIEDQVKYSTIELTFTQPNSVYKEITENMESLVISERPSFWEQVKQSVIDGWYMILTVILGIISLWWFWILIVIVYFIYRLLRRIVKKLDVHTNIKK